jgi:hypothetical protein
LPPFHIEDAGTEALVALAPPFQFSIVPTGVDGIEVARDQDAGLALPGMRKAGADAAGKTLAGRRCARWSHP